MRVKQVLGVKRIGGPGRKHQRDKEGRRGAEKGLEARF